MGVSARAILLRILREPLLHFLIFGLAIFAVYRSLSPSQNESADKIVVTEARVEQLAGLFSKTWQRPPTALELKGLIDEFVKEEVYYREAVALGLDRDDTVVRRRLRQKYEFVAIADAAEPHEAELKAYLQRNAERYASEPRISFEQIYFDPQRHVATLDADLAEALSKLRSGTLVDFSDVGDTTLLPKSAKLAKITMIARDFGNEFAQSLMNVETDQWTGPVVSSFGKHLVFVSRREPSQAAKLDQVRAAVTRDLMQERRKEREAQQYKELLKKYDVIVSAPLSGELKQVGAK
jgi:hypothetical protein